jgi:type VI secretion system protein ImpJ
MSDPRHIPEAVQWFEGMLLAPQHFQLADRRAEALQAYHLHAASPFHWGVRRLAFDSSLLLTGIFRITEMEAILPDGLVVVHPTEDAGPLEVNLQDKREALRNAPLTVHLVVPTAQTHAVAGLKRRYRSVKGTAVTDDNTGEGEVSVARLRPNLELTTSSAPTKPPDDHYTSLPVAVISVREVAFAAEPFAPPRLDVPRGTPLSDLCLSVATALRARAATLAERSLAASAGSEAAAGEAAATVRALVGPLPRLEAMLATELVHPFQLYLALCDVMGALGVLSPSGVPPVPPAYLHADPLPAFGQLTRSLLNLLDRVREPYEALRFAALGEGRFSLRIERDWLQGGELLIGARASAGQPMVMVAEWLSRALIGSAPHISGIRLRRIRGAERRRLENTDGIGFLPPASMVLVAVTVDPEFIDGDEALEIQGPSSDEHGGVPGEVVLYLRRGDGGATA